ncbi:MAG: response regulator transcription factor [Cellvibrionaceae bacterium]|nr:response regulator transcription factor [Cellvibrionaceae bacterium]
MRVLMIDDDRDLCELLQAVLQRSQVSVALAHDGESGVAMMDKEKFDIVLLDVMLPAASGFDVLQRVRMTSDVVVIMLTAKGDEQDRIKGLDLGADDYIPKPFSADELLARMRAILRRTNKKQVNNSIQQEDVVFYPTRNEVEVAGKTVTLTGVESVVLKMLMLRAGEPVSRGHLYRTVLNRDPTPYDRSLDTHVSSLRKKLGPTVKGSQRILSVRGVGYQYAS